MKKKTQKAKRAPLVVAPKDLTQVNELVSELGTIDRMLEAEKARLEERIEKLRRASAEGYEMVVLKRADIVREITKYAKKNRTKILPEDRKSLELASGTIGWRFGPWKVKVSGDEELLILWLEAHDKPEYVRTITELNRERLLADRPEDVPDVDYEQKERFFIEPKEEASNEASTTVVSMVRVM